MQWVQLFFQTGLPSRISILPRGQTEAHLPQETHALVTRNFLAWTNTGTFEMLTGPLHRASRKEMLGRGKGVPLLIRWIACWMAGSAWAIGGTW